MDRQAARSREGCRGDGPQGLPLFKPPWGRITAIDLNAGDARVDGAERRHAGMRQEPPGAEGCHHSADRRTRARRDDRDEDVAVRRGGWGRARVHRVRCPADRCSAAYDKKTGAVVSALKLPLNQTGIPMTYMLNNKQYIVGTGRGDRTTGRAHRVESALMGWEMPAASCGDRGVGDGHARSDGLAIRVPRRPPRGDSRPPRGRSQIDLGWCLQRAQAARGEDVYAEECASCHGRDLAGGDGSPAPPLAGTAFVDSLAGMTVAQVFERVRETMPQDSPGRLSARRYVDILAYIFKVNRFPIGSKELEADLADAGADSDTESTGREVIGQPLGSSASMRIEVLDFGLAEGFYLSNIPRRIGSGGRVRPRARFDVSYRRGGCMFRHIRTLIVVAAGFLLAPSVALAQSAIAGVVKDTTGAVLPGVTVEASSPALIEKVRAARTDEAGQYPGRSTCAPAPTP